MPINDYVAAYERGVEVNDMLQHKLQEAYIALENGLVEGTVLKKGKLKEEATRVACAKAFYDVLKDYAVARVGSTTTDEDVKADLTFGTFGINLEEVIKFLDKKKERTSLDELRQHVNADTAFRYFLNRNTGLKPKGKLKKEDAAEAVRYTKTEDRVDPAKLDVDEIAELLSEYVRERTITETFLADKEYRLVASPVAAAGRPN